MMEWLPAIGTGLQVFGAISGGSKRADQARAEGAAAQQAAAYNASVAQSNAAIARDEARIAGEQGAESINQFLRQAEQVQGTAIATYGASGVVSSEGSPLDILAQSAGQAAYDANMMKYKTDLRVRSNLMRAQQFEQDAAFQIQSGSAAMSRAQSAAEDAESAGWMNAASTLFGSATKYGWLGSSGGGGGSGTGFQAPRTVNLSSMGGGQGIYGTMKW